MRGTLARIHAEMRAAAIDEPFRFAAAMSDGRQLTVFRWSSDESAPSVYYRQSSRSLVVVSEPIDDHADGWQALSANHLLSIACGEGAGLPMISAFGMPGEAEPGLEMAATQSGASASTTELLVATACV